MCSNYRVVHKHSPTVGSLIVFVLDKTELFPKTHWLCSYNPEQHDKLNMQRHQDDCMTWLSRRASVGGEGGDGVGKNGTNQIKSVQLCLSLFVMTFSGEDSSLYFFPVLSFVKTSKERSQRWSITPVWQLLLIFQRTKNVNKYLKLRNSNLIFLKQARLLLNNEFNKV